MQRVLAYISLVLCLLSTTRSFAQLHFPQHEGEKAVYNASITMPKGSLSGICMLVQDSDSIKGAIVNEFGVSFLDFVYTSKDDKVHLASVIAMMDKWYIRIVLESDLQHVIHELKDGNGSYIDEKYKISYNFVPLNEQPEKDDDGTELPDWSQHD